jgi:outer membrane receptor protein involved in Fe transport
LAFNEICQKNMLDKAPNETVEGESLHGMLFTVSLVIGAVLDLKKSRVFVGWEKPTWEIQRRYGAMPSLSRASWQETSRQMRQRFVAVVLSVRWSTVLAAVCLSLVLCTISVPTAKAQAVYGSIGGTVVDSSGSTVANAKVTITDTARQVVFATQTDNSGRYDERHLIAGHYQVKVEAQGFKTVVSLVDVSVDSLTTFDATLQPGAISETVNVVDEVPLLKTERTDVSTVLSSEQVNELPTFGRNFSQLLLVTPGTVQFCWGDTSTENPQSGLAVNVNGQMFVGVNTILDGTDNRDFLYGNMLIVPTLDSIAETKVTTSSYDAEFGQISAALVTVSTKSGTDKWHGSGFFYRRSDATFARDPFAQANPDPVTGRFIPQTLWGQFGGSIGGAIIKNKLFIFGDYQGTRAHDGGSAEAVVPTQAERSGDFSAWASNNPIFNPFCTSGTTCVNGIQDNLAARPQFSYNGRLNVIDPALISPVATALLNYVPLPLPALENAPGYQLGNPNFAASGEEIYHADALDVRADYFSSDKLRLFDRYTFTQFHKEAPGLFGGAVGGPQLNQIGYTGVGDTRPQSNSFGVSYAISPSLLMDVRFGWYKQRINVDPLVDGNFATQAGAPGLNIPTDPTTNNMPHFSIGEGPGELDFGNGLYNNCNCPLIERMQQFQEIGNLTWTVGKHTFKFGPDFHYLQNLRLPSDQHRSGEVFTTDALTEGLNLPGLGMAGFLLGEVSQFDRYISKDETAGERQWRFFFYGQDTWRITSKLTLNYGLRWEIYRPQSVTGKDQGGWYNLANNEIDVAGENGVPLSGPVVTNLKNFAPRAGLAYQIDPKTVVRMGYGRSFDVGMFGTIFGHTVTQNLPVLGTQQINPEPNQWDSAFALSTGPPLLDPATTLDSQPVGPDGNHIYPNGVNQFRAWVMPFHTLMPTVDSWNASVQRQITPTLSLQAAYVGNKGSHIFVGENNWINLNTQTEAGFCTPTILAMNPVPTICQSAQMRLPYYQSPHPYGLSVGLQCMCNPGDNHYNSLQVQLDQRLWHGLNILGNYTFSHAKNHDSPDFLYAPSLEYGRPAWQRNQNITVSTIYELPFGKGKALAGNAPSALNYVIGGWQVINVTTIMSGSGVNPNYGECGDDNDAGVCFPNVVGSWHVSHPNKSGWFATTALVPQPGGGLAPTPLDANGQSSGPWQRPAAPAPGSPSFGNAQRDSIIGPKWFDSDLSVVKNVLVGEQFRVEFRAEAFNVFNHPNLGDPNSCVDCSNGGTITGLANNAIMRRMQFGLRFDF